METVKNVDYFAQELENKLVNIEDPGVHRIINDLIHYARTLENSIPPAENRPQRPRPEGRQSPQFRAMIVEVSDSFDSETLSLLEEFLTYIESMEDLIYQE